MAIIFREDRELVDGGRVEAGKIYDTFSPEDEAAFVANGVADLVAPEAAKKRQAAEVSNG